ncbi:hypothetical protein Csa_017558 [Cucumis sativus]|uniref:Uncharacterized protein n=1 Tax=Cucumis sativus TaxID=3659 RepID=A0A0A0LAY0_CUCSA|nr:hypothetical protein Csa_017558 [Cucumis sativus]
MFRYRSDFLVARSESTIVRTLGWTNSYVQQIQGNDINNTRPTSNEQKLTKIATVMGRIQGNMNDYVNFYTQTQGYIETQGRSDRSLRVHRMEG